MIRAAVMTLIAAGLISALPAVSRPPTRSSVVQSAAQTIGEAAGLPLKIVAVAPAHGDAFAVSVDGQILISPLIVAQVDSPAEALALVAVLASYLGPDRDRIVVGHATSLSTLAAAVGAVAIGPHDRDYAVQQSNTRVINQSVKPAADSVPLSRAIPSGPLAASRATRWLESAGGCTGAVVAMFGKLSRTGGGSDDPAAISAGIFARSVLKDMRASIYPPDNRCL